MKLNEKFDATIWGVLCVIGATAVVVGGATWTFSRTIQSDELEGYRKANDWKVKDAIAEITKLSKQAELNSKERTEFLELRAKVALHEMTLSELKARHQNETSKLADQVKSLEKQNKELRNALDSIVKKIDLIEVPKGEARFVVQNTLAIGVEQTFESFASVRIGDTSIITMHPAEKRTVNLGAKQYVVTLMKIGKNTCEFAFGEIEKSD
jgi:DNA repair exonuclease SbcCD ATPase subunit